jgi:tetratricopeptide (TPR) repeat protein
MKNGKRTEAPGRRESKTAARQSRPGWQWWHYWLIALVGLFAVYEAYGPALKGAFVFDDRGLPFLNPRYGGATLVGELTSSRPLLMATYWLNYQSSGLDPGAYHFWNVVFHFLAAVMVGLCLRRILGFADVPEHAARLLALFGAGVFLLHPAQTESVAYVASRSENLSALLYYAAFAVFLWRVPAPVDWLWGAPVLLLFGLAVLTKEHTMTLPALLLLADYWWNPRFSLEGAKRNWRLYMLIAVAATGGALFVARTIRLADTVGFGLKNLSPADYFWSQGRAIWVYLRLFVAPFGLNADYDFAVSRSPLDQGALFGWLSLAALSAAAWNYRRRFPLASFGFLAFLMMLAPTSSVIPIRDLVAERRLYLPMFGLLLVAIEFLRRWRAPLPTRVAAMGTIVLLCAIGTYQRAGVWASPAALWQDTVSKSPNKARPRFQLAYALYEEGQCEQAAGHYEATSKLQPPAYDLFLDWALALDCAGLSAPALEKLQQAAAIERTAHVMALTGMVHAKQGRWQEALGALEEAEKLDPRFAMTYVYRGNVFEVSQQPDLAAQQYRKALEVDPSLEAARQALARVSR